MGQPGDEAMSICGGILAGGQSLRFGTDKSWALHAGRPLISHLIDALRPQVQELLISVRQPSAAHERLGLELVPDGTGEGPLAGVAALLTASSQRHEWLLTVPCDALRVPADWASRLLRLAQLRQAPLVVLHDGARAHPCFALLHRCLLDSLRAALAQGARALFRWQASVAGRVDCIAAPPLNLNTPQALAALQARGDQH